MDLKELEYIVTIAEEGSINKAAQKLYLAQSSLSQFLARYEAELRTKLFVRTGAGIRPTPAGEIMVRNARQMLRQYHRVRAELQEALQPSSGRILFGVSSFRGAALIPPVLKRFQTEYPAVEVHITEMNSVELRKRVAAGDLDMALIAVLPNERKEEGRAVMQDEVCLVSNRAHPVMEYVHYDSPGRPWIDLADTADFEYLLSNRATVLGSIASEQFEARGLKPPVINGDLTAAFAMEMASYGLGLAFSYRSCRILRNDVEFLSIGPEGYFVDLVLIFPPDGFRSPSIRALEKMIRDFYRDRNRV